MNVGQYVKEGGGEYLPLLDTKAFNKEAVKGTARGKILAVREIHSKGGRDKKTGKMKDPWNGLALDLKCPGGKYSFLVGFDRFDIGALARQCKSEDTDDWIGQTIRFVSKKGTKGGVFVNVAGK